MTDYISREAFAAEMKERQTEAGKWLRDAKDHDTAVRADAVLSFLCEVKLTLDKLPAADVRPVVMGRWIDTDNYYQRWKCSVCDSHTRDARPPFCPNCGADMRPEPPKEET